ncbi:MAG: UDP-glucose/GDP-mannose dehydrogenase family protein [Calditrichaeota bacterium]|nr:UDP-glucose/GDP-mannose dehydrogenase family protein [Calditrichota bacterium]MCB9066451.1 UDP-glucose/GDP-mannose dehydrogenase family protein [Calditrichia bacterium]
MKIIVAGTGYVGLVHAAICSEYGHEVHGYDTNPAKIDAYATGNPERIHQFVNEPGLADIISDNLGKHLFFTHKIDEIIEGTDVIFLCLPAPANADGSSNLELYDSAVHKIAALLAKRSDLRRVVITDKSTVPIGTIRRLQRILHEHGAKNVGIATNPEFLAEGTAVSQARKPSRVVVGCDSKDDFKILRRVYSQFVNHVRIKYIETTPETAEAIKYVSNTLLLTYISFWNGVGARIGEKIANVRVDDLRRGVTADERISTWGSYMSNGAGGSCFGKDIQSLIFQLKKHDVNTRLLESTFEINEFQKTYLVKKAIQEANFNFEGKVISILGLAFKKQTNDIRDASSLKAIETLLGYGVRRIQAYDPLAIEEAKKYYEPEKSPDYQKIVYSKSVREALIDSDALFISTDWEEFRGLSSIIENTVSPPYLIIDGRRMIPDYEDLVAHGYTYLAVGSPTLKPKQKRR